MRGVALDLYNSLVTTTSFYHRAADMIHELDVVLVCRPDEIPSVHYYRFLCFTSYCS